MKKRFLLAVLILCEVAGLMSFTKITNPWVGAIQMMANTFVAFYIGWLAVEVYHDWKDRKKS